MCVLAAIPWDLQLVDEVLDVAPRGRRASPRQAWHARDWPAFGQHCAGQGCTAQVQGLPRQPRQGWSEGAPGTNAGEVAMPPPAAHARTLVNSQLINPIIIANWDLGSLTVEGIYML